MDERTLELVSGDLDLGFGLTPKGLCGLGQVA